MRLVLVTLIIVLCMCGCSRTYTEQDFADSKWNDSNGAIIELSKNGTCNVRDINWASIYPTSWISDSIWKEEHPQSFLGHWAIKLNRHGEQEINIQIEKKGHGFSFGIKNINTIERIIGDPDDCNYYKFTRICYSQ